MAQINVNRSVPDPFYRYKMPRLLAKVEGKGNGIKTVIVNMADIAKSLDRPAAYPTKYFGCELGAQTNVDTKNERYIVNGEHDANKLQDILDGFIRKFVLCTACDNPETVLSVRRNVINSKCKACGHAGTIDGTHRLITFITKNPPPNQGKEKKKEESNGNGNGNAAENENDEKAASGGSDQDSNHGHANGKHDDEDDDDWAEDENGEGQGAPAADSEITKRIGRLIMDKDLDRSVEERLDMLHNFYTDLKKAGRLGEPKIMLHEAERLDIKSKASLLLIDVLFDENILKDGQIKKHAITLRQFTNEDSRAQRYLLGGIEQLIVRHKATLLPKSAHIIKALYDQDICDEDAIIAWGDKPSSKFVSKSESRAIIEKTEPVLKWLKEAEEESEEDEEDDEVDFTDRVQHKSAAAPAAKKEENGGAKKKEEEDNSKVKNEDGDEIDIDDI